MEKNNKDKEMRKQLYNEYMAIRPKIVNGTATPQEKEEFYAKRLLAHSYFGKHC